jgi:hypothetical protein
MSDPEVSWKALEKGAQVFSADGEAVAKVSRVVGDVEADVFTGLAVTLRALGGERFIPSERVKGIWPDRVDVDLTRADFDGLDPYVDEPVVRVRPGDRAGRFLRRLFGRY